MNYLITIEITGGNYSAIESVIAESPQEAIDKVKALYGESIKPFLTFTVVDIKDLY